MQVRITDPGFAGFTGYFGAIKFEDGVSEHISHAEAERLGCIVKCETLDGLNPSATQRMVDIQRKDLDALTKEGKGVIGASREQDADNNKQPVAKPDKKAAQNVHGVQPSLDFTREDLEALADKEGIAGLRNLGSQFGVKGRAIAEIIDELMQIKAERQPVAQAKVE